MKVKRKNPFIISPAFTLMGFILSLIPSSDAADGNWSGAVSGAWLNTGNWDAVPGATGVTSNTNIATFGTNANNTIGIDMGSAGGNYSLGAIHNTNSPARLIGNSSTTTAGTLTLNGATVNGIAGTIVRNSVNTLLTLQGAQTSATMSLGLTNATSRITIDGTGGVTITAPITGNGGLVKDGSGSGVLTIQGVLAANNYTGGTTVNTGILAIAVVANLPGYSTSGGAASGAFTVASGATLSVSNAVTAANVALMTGTTGNFQPGSYLGLTTGAAAWSSTIAGVQGLNKWGANTLTLSAANTFSGDTKITAGILALTNGLALQNSALNTAASSAGTASIGLSTTANSLTFGGLTGNKDLATVFTTGTNGYTGVTSLTLNPGSGITNSYSGAIANGAMTLTKTGLGTQALSATHFYTGATAVNNGTLSIESAGSINSTSGITVAAGAKLIYNSSTSLTVGTTLNGSGTTNRAVLGGNGIIATTIALNDVGDTLSPGNSPGTLSFSTSQTWDSFSYDWEVNDFTGTTPGLGGDFDQLGITGALTLSTSGNYILNVLSLTALNEAGAAQNFAETTRLWTILTTTGGITNFDAGKWSLVTTGFTNADSGTWTIGEAGGNLVLSYSAVPEPNAAALVNAVLMVALLRRRRA